MPERYAAWWCEEWDLNPHGFLHTPLKRTRLPVPPSSQAKYILQDIEKKVKSKI